MSDANRWGTLIAQEVESALAARLQNITSPVLRKAIEATVRDVVTQKLEKNLPGLVENTVHETVQEIIDHLEGGKKSPRKKAPSTPANDFGGKYGSGSKSSPSGSKSGSRSTPSGSKSGSKSSPSRSSRSYGGKGGPSYGGK